MLAAGGAGDVVLLHKLLHLGLAHGVHAVAQVKAVLLAPILDDLVGAEAFLTLLAVHQGVGEAAHVAGGHPHLGIHQNGGVQAHVVGVLLNELLPPCLFHIVFQLHTQGTVVPGVGQSAVDLAAGENEAPALTQVDDLLHGLFGVFHGNCSFSSYCLIGSEQKKRPEPLGLRANMLQISAVPPEFVSG